MYGDTRKSMDMEEYGSSTYIADMGDVWSMYLSQIELADEEPCLELIPLLFGFFSTPPGQGLVSQVFLALSNARSVKFYIYIYVILVMIAIGFIYVKIVEIKFIL